MCTTYGSACTTVVGWWSWTAPGPCGHFGTLLTMVDLFFSALVTWPHRVQGQMCFIGPAGIVLQPGTHAERGSPLLTSVLTWVFERKWRRSQEDKASNTNVYQAWEKGLALLRSSCSAILWVTLLITRHNLILSLRGRLIPSSFAGWIQHGSLDQDSGIELDFIFPAVQKTKQKPNKKCTPPRKKLFMLLYLHNCSESQEGDQPFFFWTIVWSHTLSSWAKAPCAVHVITLSRQEAG